MPNITKLKLQDDIEYTLSTPILLDQEESTSTTSAPSSAYIKSKIDEISNKFLKYWKLFEIEELPQQDGLDMYDYWNMYGTYKCSNTERVNTFLHCPMDQAFILLLTGIDVEAYPLQIYINYTGSTIAMQYCDNWMRNNPPDPSQWHAREVKLNSYTYS